MAMGGSDGRHPDAAERAAAPWRRLPELPPAPASWLWALLSWLLAALPMTSQLRDLDHVDASIWRAVSVTFLGVVVASRRPRWAIGAFALTAAVLLTDRSVPPITLLLLVALAALWCVVTPAVSIRWLGTRRGVGRVVAAVVLLAADVVLLVRVGVRVPLALAVVAAAAVVVDSRLPVRDGPESPVVAKGRRLAAANASLMDRVGRPIGVAVGFLVMLPSALLVLLPWAAQRLVRFDVLAPPTRRPSRWVGREGGDPDASRAYAAPTVRRPPTGRGLHRALAGLMALVLLAAVVVPIVLATTTGDDDVVSAIEPVPSDDPCHDPEPNPVLDDQPDSAELGCELKAFVSRPRFQALTVFDYPDRSGEWVNQENGIRAGWTPPACDCERLTVWWFGGSAAWGWDQRDQFSLPSQIAKHAWNDYGIALDIVNYAMPAWVLSQEMQRFQLLTMTEPLPDLVLFYDGGNELNRQKERDGRGEGADESETSFLETELDRYLWRGLNTADPEELDGPTSRTPGPRVSPEEIAEHAMNRYEKWVDHGRRIMEPMGLDPIFLWQPLMHSAPDVAARPGGVPEVDVPIWKRMVPEAVRRLPDGVVDLSDSLDGVDRPVFDDFYHTNEYAADVVAKDLVDRLAPRFREELAATGDAG